jgi:hypothetical protein
MGEYAKFNIILRSLPMYTSTENIPHCSKSSIHHIIAIAGEANGIKMKDHTDLITIKTKWKWVHSVLPVWGVSWGTP